MAVKKIIKKEDKKIMRSESKKENYDLTNIGYTLGIISIVFAFFSPLVGIIFGIIGLNISKKEKTNLSKKALKLNKIGIILGIIIIIIMVGVFLISLKFGISNPAKFPLA